MKTSIGAFIAQLRKEQNVTQKELADHLFISDKTISRWESGKSTPDLDLIPSIADFFKVSVDELLRGERIPAPIDLQNKEIFNDSKTQEDTLKNSLQNKQIKFKNLTFISAGIFITGLFIAIICNFVFYRALLGFCLSTLFTCAACICQACFINSFLFRIENNKIKNKSIISTYNSDIIKLSIRVFLFISCLFGLAIPFAFVSNFMGLQFMSWLCLGILWCFILYIITHIIYKICLEKGLIAKGWIVLTDKEEQRNTLHKKTLKKVGVPCGVIGVVLVLGIIVVSLLNVSFFIQPYTFDDYEEFKKYMATYDFANPDGDIIGGPDKSEEENKEPVFYYLYNSKNEIVCEYEWNNKDAYRIQVNTKTDNCLPIKVYAHANYYEALDTQATIVGCIKIALGMDFVVFAILYLIKMRKGV